MLISFDPAKRDATFAERGLAFEDAVEVFTGSTYDLEDDRQDYGETRMITVGGSGSDGDRCLDAA